MVRRGSQKLETTTGAAGVAGPELAHPTVRAKRLAASTRGNMRPVAGLFARPPTSAGCLANSCGRRLRARRQCPAQGLEGLAYVVQVGLKELGPLSSGGLSSVGPFQFGPELGNVGG